MVRPLLAPPSTTRLCGEGRPHLVLVTDLGTIAAELFEPAAPSAVRRVAELISEPPTSGEPFTIDYTHPHIEVYTSLLAPEEELLLPNEIDAVALGLDQVRVKDAGEAMDVFQREIIPAFNRVKKGGEFHPRLREWIEKWRATSDPGFLVGASRMEINEAIGYVYTRGPDSRPVTKGSLTLQPRSPSSARARIGIALADFPNRIGRQMVIGRVVEGLELADRVSVLPLAVPPGMRSLDYAPRDPLVIRSRRIECR